MHLNASANNQLMQIKSGCGQSYYPSSPWLITAVNDRMAPMLRSILLQTSIMLLLAGPTLAASPAEQRGKAFALTNCAKCHSVDRVTQSPLKIAPPFRTLHLRYPVETLAEA